MIFRKPQNLFYQQFDVRIITLSVNLAIFEIICIFSLFAKFIYSSRKEHPVAYIYTIVLNQEICYNIL